MSDSPPPTADSAPSTNSEPAESAEPSEPFGRPPAYAAESPQSQNEQRTLGILALIAVGVIGWIVLPVGIGILLGMLTGFTLQPLYDRMLRRQFRPVGAALACVAIAATSFVIVLGGLGSLLVIRGTVLTEELIAASAPGGPVRTTAERLIARLNLQTQADSAVAKLRGAAAEVASQLATIAARIAGRTFGAVLVLIFLMMTLYFVLRHGRTLEQRAVDCLPLHPRHSRELLDQLRRVGRATLLGMVVTGVVQGILAAIGYVICGVPEPAFFGAATVVASFLPGIGTLLVIVPVGGYLIATGHVVGGISELAYGLLVVGGVTDYLIRPRLMGGAGDMPTLVTFAAIFGGVEVFGLIGIVVGPLFVALAVAVLRIYARDRREMHAALGTVPPP